LTQLKARQAMADGFVARDANEARAIVTRILKDAGVKSVTKGKSMVTEEIELNAHLLAESITPVETDLGEYIIQLRGEKPSHIVAPAFHLKRDQVEASFRKAHQTLPPARALDNRPALVAEARAMLRQREAAGCWDPRARTFWWRKPPARSSSRNEGMVTLRGFCRAYRRDRNRKDRTFACDVSILLRLLPAPTARVTPMSA
jgi:hypothetical protein